MVEFRIARARRQLPLGAKPFHVWTRNDDAPWLEFYRTDHGYLLRFPALADFQVSSDGVTATCFPAPDVLDETPQHLYLNQVLPLILSDQGELIFHASAVEVGDAAVAFIGESGRGKSTLAAAFATSRFRFLADDGLVIKATLEGFEALPSHPFIRLWEDSEQALIASGTTKTPALHYTSKVRFLAGESLPFCQWSRTLRRMYFLGNGTATEIGFTPLSAADALVECVRHSFLLDVEKRPRLASHFGQIAELAKHPIHYRLDYPRLYDDLASIRRAIVEHALSADDLV